MTVTLNGDERTCQEGSTLTDLINELGLGKRRIAIEVNREIIPRDEYATYCLQSGDQIEIVHFVGGG
jgi:sulfur carrier protein